MQIMALHIVRHIADKICKSLCFSIMADECTDIANKEQFTICFGWIDSNLQDHEDFIGLYEVDNIGANCLVHHNYKRCFASYESQFVQVPRPVL